MSIDPIRRPFLVLRDERFLDHDPGADHPEHPGRLRAIHEGLDARPIAGTMTASPPAADVRLLARVHDSAYLRAVESTRGREVRLDVDTVASPRSWDAALLAAGAAREAALRVVQGDAGGAFALVRPPGHHAESDRAMGFCLFNNVAVAAEFATSELGCRRVLILDPDVHHGNGTQHTFYDRSDVLYVSSHRYPFYPGTGAAEEIGVGEGAGFTVNLPMTGGMGDAEFLHLYRAVVEPIVDEWQPELVLVSAGFDTWHRDPMGGMAMTERGFTGLFGLFAQWAARHCPGRIALALEGGYDAAGLAAGVRAAIEVVTGAREVPAGIDSPVSPRAVETARRVSALLSSRWRSLADH